MWILSLAGLALGGGLIGLGSYMIGRGHGYTARDAELEPRDVGLYARARAEFLAGRLNWDSPVEGSE